MFEDEKSKVLGRADNSRKGSIDKRIMPLVKLLNTKENYYTTSSCAGRIMLLVPGANKKDTEWLFISHEPVSLRQALSGKLPKADVWFRQEAMILHVCCKDLGDAKRLLEASKLAGFKRSGIISLGQRIIVEIVGSSHFETILSRKGKLLLTKEALLVIIAEANRRLKKNFAQIEKFKKAIK